MRTETSIAGLVDKVVAPLSAMYMHTLSVLALNPDLHAQAVKAILAGRESAFSGQETQVLSPSDRYFPDRHAWHPAPSPTSK
jgi:hypothetical protein